MKRKDKVILDNYQEQRDNEIKNGESRTNYRNVFVESLQAPVENMEQVIKMRSQGRYDDRNEI